MKASQNTGNTEKKALTLTLKGFPLFVHWCSSQKQKTYSFAQVALAIEKPISHSSLSDSWDIGFS